MSRLRRDSPSHHAAFKHGIQLNVRYAGSPASDSSSAPPSRYVPISFPSRGIPPVCCGPTRRPILPNKAESTHPLTMTPRIVRQHPHLPRALLRHLLCQRGEAETSSTSTMMTNKIRFLRLALLRPARGRRRLRRRGGGAGAASARSGMRRGRTGRQRSRSSCRGGEIRRWLGVRRREVDPKSHAASSGSDFESLREESRGGQWG
jgi:hypothetical protein